MNLLSTVIISLFCVLESFSFPVGYYSGQALTNQTLADVISQVKPGTVIVIGEKHYNSSAQQGQLAVLKELRRNGFPVSVGMEFISYPNQTFLEFYKVGRLPEDEFLTQVSWGKSGFEFYRDQILFPEIKNGEATLAINAPRQLTSKIAKVGIAGLSTEEQLLLPPGLQIGRAEYRKRFGDIMTHLPNPAALDNYFAAQSVWDETMAWQTAEYMKTHPQHVFVIIVGEFHVQYGGGLPDRLRARGVNSILTLSQVDHSDYSDEELKKEMIPHPEYGPRADFLWIF